MLVESLQNEDWYTRWQACLGLCAFGPAAKEAVPALLPTLCDEQQYVCREALLALRQIAPTDKRVVLALGALLRADHPVDMSALFFALDAAGEAARPVAVDLVDLLDRDDRHTARVLRILETCSPLPRTVHLLLARSKNGEAQLWASDRRGRKFRGRETQDTVGLLLLRGLVSEETVRLALLELLSRDLDTRDTAAAGLRRIGAARNAIVPSLIRLLAGEHVIKRTQARDVLRMIDAADIEKLVRTDDETRFWLDLSDVDGGHVLTLLDEDKVAEQMLAALSSAVTEDPFASLKRSLDSKDESTHACALFLMSRVGWNVEGVRTELERSLRHASARVRTAAAEGLAYMGKPRAESDIPFPPGFRE